MKQVELAQRLGISKSYLSMILKENRRLTPELAEKLQRVPGVHKVVNFQALGLLHTQEVTGSNPVLPTSDCGQAILRWGQRNRGQNTVIQLDSEIATTCTVWLFVRVTL